MEWLFWGINLLIPLTMVILGLVYARANTKSGQSGSQTLQSNEARRVTHKKAGRLLITGGLLMAAAAAGAMVWKPMKPALLSLLVVGVQLLAFAGVTIAIAHRRQN